ncbi:hypothetical protein TRFO_27023 [Tritrichomonas foetus]|uniref:Uncharacterized protein n=1 Tax=Tritrichomonas foetus TaxID=1144522 RepID=A0A1J4K6E3_9EUKA|nr:hypothetical protein TRFO_27023 [Tritrichomonas foetus]|eukprot:OHT05270.1 hypothetical protein TRFO_27023 [Tritrichomonas foetus]
MSNTNTSLSKARKPIITRPNTRKNNANNSRVNSRVANNRPAPQSRAQSRAKSSANQPPQKSKAELEEIRNKLFDGTEFSEFTEEELNQVYPHLREYAYQKGSEEDYDEAQKAFQLSENILAELKNRNPNEDREGEIGQKFTSRQNNFEEEWQMKFDDYDENTAVRQKDLDETHEEQRTSFERLWNEDMPRRYRKPSQRLLQIKKIEKSLALSCEFERAKQIHLEAEKLAEEELQLAQANLNRDYEIALQRLLKKQEEEKQSLLETRAHLRNILMSRYEEEKSAVNNRSLVVSTRQQEAQKGYRTSKRRNEPIGTGGTFSGNADRKLHDVLLPPLRPPNDPGFLEEDKKRKRELQKKKLAYQKNNAKATLAKYTVDGQEYSNYDANSSNYNSRGNSNQNTLRQTNDGKNQAKSGTNSGLSSNTDNNKGGSGKTKFDMIQDVADRVDAIVTADGEDEPNQNGGTTSEINASRDINNNENNNENNDENNENNNTSRSNSSSYSSSNNSRKTDDDSNNRSNKVDVENNTEDLENDNNGNTNINNSEESKNSESNGENKNDDGNAGNLMQNITDKIDAIAS